MSASLQNFTSSAKKLHEKHSDEFQDPSTFFARFKQERAFKKLYFSNLSMKVKEYHLKK